MKKSAENTSPQDAEKNDDLQADTPSTNLIEALIASGQLIEAHRCFGEFLRICNRELTQLVQNEGVLSNLRDLQMKGVVGYADDLERNRIQFSLLTQLDEFRRNVLGRFFDIGNRDEFFNNIQSRDAIISEILGLRLRPKRYKLELPFLKDGNSSIIFRLQNVDTDRHAIAMVFKVPEMTRENREEIVRLTELRHRNVIKLLDFEISRFPFFVVTEYVHGENLPNIIDKVGPRPPAQVADWLYQLTDALEYLRQKRIWHTNVRPSKIYIDDEGQVMISPFDLLKVGAGENTLTRYRDVCQYGSPELLYGGDEKFTMLQTCVSDQYSLGLVAYKMLVGKDLLEGKAAHDILDDRRRFEKDAAWRKKRLAKLPEIELSHIIRRLIEEKPEQRFQDLHEVLRILQPLTRADYPGTAATRLSYRRCLSANKNFTHDFYAQLFENEQLKHTREHFRQPKRQAAMLQMAVDLLLDLEERRDILTQLFHAPQHHAYSIDEFDAFLDILLAQIQKDDARWGDVKAEWAVLKEKTMRVIREVKKAG
jgi:serine/threonine protein kinase